MYSGTTLTKFSGRMLGAHQKFDSVARRHITKLGIDKSDFPGIRRILHFEGKHGPDAIKRKSPAVDEPWHYFDPFDDQDTQLLELISDHYTKLVDDLKKDNQEKAAFEAAWLAHAIVDGLTPAHHYPYEAELEKLRGQSKETRVTIKDKWLLPGATRSKQAKNNFLMWGPRGLFTNHAMFEMGVAAIIKPLTFKEAIPTHDDIEKFPKAGPDKWFKQKAREIAVLDLYHGYIDKGWTPKLAWQVRHRLAPIIIETIALTWYQAVQDAKK